MRPGWHIYWPGVNDTGFAPAFTFDLPEGWKAGELLWPGPSRHISPGDILDHVYEREVTILVPVLVPKNAARTDAAKITVRAEWLACEKACVPEESTLAFSIPVKDNAKSSPAAPAMERSRRLLPAKLPESSGTVSVRREGSRIEARAAGAAVIEFYPAESCAEIADLLKTGSARSDRLSLELTDARSTKPVIGILGVRRTATEPFAFYEVNLPAAGPAPASGEK